eukprot:7483229-Pyramimonas_sp.AAC.2
MRDHHTVGYTIGRSPVGWAPPEPPLEARHRVVRRVRVPESGAPAAGGRRGEADVPRTPPEGGR